MKKDLSKKISLLLCSTLFLSSVVGPSFVGATKGKTDSAANSDNSRKSATAVKRPRDVRGKEEEPVRKRKPVIVVTEEPISEVAKPDTATESAEDEPPVLMPVPTTAEGESTPAAASAQTQLDASAGTSGETTSWGRSGTPKYEGTVGENMSFKDRNTISKEEDEITGILWSFYQRLRGFYNDRDMKVRVFSAGGLPNYILKDIMQDMKHNNALRKILSDIMESSIPGDILNNMESSIPGDILNNIRNRIPCDVPLGALNSILCFLPQNKLGELVLTIICDKYLRNNKVYMELAAIALFGAEMFTKPSEFEVKEVRVYGLYMERNGELEKLIRNFKRDYLDNVEKCK